MEIYVERFFSGFKFMPIGSTEFPCKRLNLNFLYSCSELTSFLQKRVLPFYENMDATSMNQTLLLVLIFASVSFQLNARFPFVPNVPFLYPLNTSEKLSVFWCFQGVMKGCIGNEWVNKCFVNDYLQQKVFHEKKVTY